MGWLRTIGPLAAFVCVPQPSSRPSEGFVARGKPGGRVVGVGVPSWLFVLLLAASTVHVGGRVQREGVSRCNLPRVPRSDQSVEHVVTCPGFAEEKLLAEHAAWVEGRHQDASAVLTGTKAHPLWSGFTLRLRADTGRIKQLYSDVLSHSGCTSVQPAVRVQNAPFTIGVETSSKSSSVGNNSTRAVPWGLQRLAQPHLPLLGGRYDPVFNGSGVDVFIVDSGMDTTHSEFSNGNGQRKAQTRQVRNLFDLSAKVKTSPPQQNDLVGHGTHVAATIGGLTVGVSPEANLYGVRVLDAQGSGYDKDILAGLIFIWDWYHAMGKRPTVINMSLGGPCLSYEKCSSNILVEAVEKLSRDGIKVPSRPSTLTTPPPLHTHAHNTHHPLSPVLCPLSSVQGCCCGWQ